MYSNDVHIIEDDESYASSSISGFSSCSEKFDDLPDGLTEEIYYAEFMRRDAYYAERKIRKAREREMQEQQQRSGNSAASQDGDGRRRHDEQQPSDEMDVASSSSMGGSSLSLSSHSEGRDMAMERQISEYNRLREAHLQTWQAQQSLQQHEMEMEEDVSQHAPNEESSLYGMGDRPMQQQEEVHSHNESSDSSSFSTRAYKRQIEEYQWLQRKHSQQSNTATAFASSASGSKDDNARYAKEGEEKDSKMAQRTYCLATTSQSIENTIPVTCSHCKSNLYRRSNPYLIHVCELCRGLMREREEI